MVMHRFLSVMRLERTVCSANRRLAIWVARSVNALYALSVCIAQKGSKNCYQRYEISTRSVHVGPHTFFQPVAELAKPHL